MGEEKQFMACGELCDADAHKKKHDIFFKTLTWVTNPVSTEYLDWATNWLAQHIKNTDFKYRYKLATNHKTPEPYIWNEEFQVSYKRLDDEHIGLFESMYDLEMNLSSQEKVDNLQRLMRDHFYYEEAQFCDALDLPWDYCKEHKKKHVKFSERFAKIVAPVDMAEIKWAQNWLAQHIKNTDFGYKGFLKHEVPEHMSGMNHLKLIIQDLTLNTTFSSQTSRLCPRTQPTKAFCKLSRTTYGHTSTSRNRGSALSPHSTV